MAYRDLTERFRVRRSNLRKRNLRFQLQHNLTHVGAPLQALFTNKKKSRTMERALLQECHHSSECHQIQATEYEQPVWIRHADDANECIRLLHIKLEYLQLVHTRRLMIRFDDSETEHEHEIDQLTQEITQLFQRADRSLKRVPLQKSQALAAQTADERVRLNTQRAIASRLQDLSSLFRRRQQEYMQRLRTQKFGLDAFDVENPAQAAGELQLYQRTGGKPMFMDLRSFEIDSRDAEIQRIAKSVAILAGVFKEVADMVIDQGTLVDRIDYNMEQVVTRMRTGTEELRKAEQFQRSTRPIRCIALLLALNFVCLLLLIAKHS